MKAYRVSTNLKLGLIGFAVVIAVASLWYTNRLVQQLRDREHSLIELWVSVLEQIPEMAQQDAVNPHRSTFFRMDSLLSEPGMLPSLSSVELERFQRAIAWAQSMPPVNQLDFILDILGYDPEGVQTQGSQLVEPNVFEIPAIIYDSTYARYYSWANVDVAHESFEDLAPEDSSALVAELDRIRERFDRIHEPQIIELEIPSVGGPPLRWVQSMHYGESTLVSDLRWFPYVQLLFVGLLILVGYIGFSYVRRSEQSSLWVGMAKEAAHQLGTPISSLMGWLEYLRLQNPDDTDLARANEQILSEVEEDIGRLRRVAARFSDIGSLPKLDHQKLAPVLESVTEYMRRRIPQKGTFVRLQLSVDEKIEAPLNAELFEWVIENLLKNALDAIDTERGRIEVVSSEKDGLIRIDVSDTGKGIDRRQWRNVFRPGYSTKKRGWGLGLSLAKRIVEDYHGGSLTLLSSRPGHGSTFRIEIPSSSR